MLPLTHVQLVPGPTRHPDHQRARTAVGKPGADATLCGRSSAEPAHGTPCDTPPFLSTNVSPGGTAVTDDDSGIVNAGARRPREQHRACHPRVRLLDALPGRARQHQVPAGRGLARLRADVHDPDRRVQLSSDGRGELQPVQSRPAARRRQGLPARPAATPASSR